VIDTQIKRVAERRTFRGKDLAWWCVSFVGFPIGGLVAETIVGPIDAVWVAAVAGAIAGAAIGAAQWFSLRQIGVDASTSGLFVRRNGALAWIGMTAAGLALGLGVGVAIFDYGTSVGDLALLGAVSGLGVGAAQWLLLRDHVGAGVLWVVGIAALWALGWTISTSIGIDVESKWAVFGASGAIAVTLLSGVLLGFLARIRSR
jgi:hypothetical protein